MAPSEFNAEKIVKAAGSRRVTAMYAFWKQSQGKHMFPAQEDLDLVSIPRLLPNLFILDVLGGGSFRYRFAGTRMEEHLGLGLTGKTLADHRSGRVLEEITEFYSRVSEEGLLGLLATRLPSDRFEWLRYIRLAMPIADDHSTVNKIIGLFLFEPVASDRRDLPTLRDIDDRELGMVKSRFGRLPPPGRL